MIAVLFLTVRKICPSDLAQRSGRIIRQGNSNPEVKIFRYATSGTFDSYLWQSVQKKQEFIAQIMSSKSPMRSCEDCDETALSYAEIKALCAGNPLIAEKMALDNEVAKLRMLKSDYKSQHYRLEDSLLKTFQQQIRSLTERIAGIEKDIANHAAQKEKCVSVKTNPTGSASVSAKFPGMIINGAAYSEKEPAAKALIESCKGIRDKQEALPIGEYMGFQMSLRYENFGHQINLLLRGAMTYQIELSTDAFGNITRINNALDSLPKKRESAQAKLDGLLGQQEAAKLELEKPFTLETELAEKEARLALLNADLNIDGDGGFDVENEPDNRNGQAEADDEAGESYSGNVPDENMPDEKESEETPDRAFASAPKGDAETPDRAFLPAPESGMEIPGNPFAPIEKNGKETLDKPFAFANPKTAAFFASHSAHGTVYGTPKPSILGGLQTYNGSKNLGILGKESKEKTAELTI